MAWDDPITEPQIKRLRWLISIHDISQLPLPQEQFLRNPDNHHRLNREQTSKAMDAIEMCDKLPPRTPSAPVDAFPNLPPGRYYIPDKFYKVDKPEDGKWKGYTFLHVQAGPTFYPVKNPKE